MSQPNFRIAVRHANKYVTLWNTPADSHEEARAIVLEALAENKSLAPARAVLVGFAGGKA